MIKTKVFTLILMTAILSLAFVSAASLNIPVSSINTPTSVNHDDGSFTITFNLENKGLASAIDWTSSSINNDATISFSSSYISEGTIADPITQTITATVNFPSNKNSNFAGVIVADPTTGSGDSVSFSIPTVIINAESSLSVEDSSVSVADDEAVISIRNTGNVNFGSVLVHVTDINGADFDDVSVSLNAGETKNVNVPVVIDEEDLEIGENSATVTVSANSESETASVTIDKTYCEVGNVGTLEIDRLKFTNNGMGDKDDWYLTDEIEVEVRVENTDNNDDVDDVIVAWGLYDTALGEFVIDDEESDFNLNDDEKKTITFKFTLDPQDFDEDYNEDDFVFYIKAYSDDQGEDLQCNSETEDITVKKDSHYVIVDNVNFVSETLPCGRELSGDFTVWNIGEDNEDEVFVMVTNSELGINEKINIGDMDVLEDVTKSFSFMIPNDAQEKAYYLRFEVYDEDGDIFENDDDDESVTTSDAFNVQGECGGSSSSGVVLISATNDAETPEALAGKQFIIRATLTNTGDETVTHTVSVIGNSAWSSLVSIDPQLVILNAGESKDVNIILNIDDDAEGDKELTIRASSGDKVSEQKVALTIGGNEPQFDAFSEHVKANWFIYVIVLVNIILIIAIILVIRSMVRPREAYA